MFDLSCHCGATRFRVPYLPQKATACTCTFCTKRGVLWGYYAPEEVVFEADGAASVYSAAGGNHHHFCGRCGCSTWSRIPDWSGAAEGGAQAVRIAVNLRLFDRPDVQALPVEVLDGRNLW